MKIKEITPELVAGFESHMTRVHQARILRKSEAAEMRFASMLFDIVKVFAPNLPSGHEFDQFATTIGPNIYLPDGLSPEERIEIVTHECEHVRQFWAGGFHYAWLYLVEPEARVTFEAESFGAGLSVHYALHDRVPTLEELALPLERGYLLDDEHVKLGVSLLKQQATSVVQGINTVRAGSEAVRWLKSQRVVT